MIAKAQSTSTTKRASTLAITLETIANKRPKHQSRLPLPINKSSMPAPSMETFSGTSPNLTSVEGVLLSLASIPGSVFDDRVPNQTNAVVDDDVFAPSRSSRSPSEQENNTNGVETRPEEYGSPIPKRRSQLPRLTYTARNLQVGSSLKNVRFAASRAPAATLSPEMRRPVSLLVLPEN